MKKEKRIWRCDLKEPCVKFCESEQKNQCGIYLKDKKLKEEDERIRIICRKQKLWQRS